MTNETDDDGAGDDGLEICRETYGGDVAVRVACRTSFRGTLLDGGLDRTGLMQWPARVAVSEWLCAARSTLKGKRLVELGCGAGGCGAVAAAASASSPRTRRPRRWRWRRATSRPTRRRARATTSRATYGATAGARSAVWKSTAVGLKISTQALGPRDVAYAADVVYPATPPAAVDALFASARAAVGASGVFVLGFVVRARAAERAAAAAAAAARASSTAARPPRRAARRGSLQHTLSASRRRARAISGMALGAALVEPLVWYAYYWVALFVLEERLWRIVSAAPLRVLRRSWFATWAYAPLHAVALALFGYALPAAAATLRSACLADRGCRGRLRSDAWGLYDDNDAQWRKFRSALPLLAAAPRRSPRAARALPRRPRVPGLAAAAAHDLGLRRVRAAARRPRRPRAAGGRAAASLRLAPTACAEAPATFRDVVAYATYAPLYLAGPVATYGDFVVRAPPPGVASYAARTAIAGLYLEAALRRTHVYALAASGAYGALPPGAAAAFAFLFINVLWLKFAFLWRCFRCWALADGVAAPENMRRFVCDNFTIAGFWRGWHASFNGWLRAYVYDDARRACGPAAASAVAFGFVAFWHDATPRLALWGAANVGFLALERALGLERRAPSPPLARGPRARPRRRVHPRAHRGQRRGLRARRRRRRQARGRRRRARRRQGAAVLAAAFVVLCWRDGGLAVRRLEHVHDAETRGDDAAGKRPRSPARAPA
ncbi:hypothetical protein JL720_16407 [Aureococcus anophagefferens]|nr:hypothetical protein JL720_16407 [Aureococcus anophagefferens]